MSITAADRLPSRWEQRKRPQPVEPVGPDGESNALSNSMRCIDVNEQRGARFYLLSEDTAQRVF